MSATSGEPQVRAYTRKRKLDQVSEDRNTIETPLALNAPSDAPNNSDTVNSTALSIRNKLKKPKTTHESASTERSSAHDNRDPEIMRRVKAPVIVYNRTSRGLSDDQIRKSVEEHKRKLLGWRYHVASKSVEREKKQLQ